MNKSAIRQIYKKKRLELTKQQVESASRAIADNFIKNLLPKIRDFQNKKLAFYVAANNEVDPIFIRKFCKELGNIVCLPRVAKDSKELDFKVFKDQDQLIRNKVYHKLLEPRDAKVKVIPEIIFVPLVAFDRKCNRVGMGGGFYDATIKKFRQKYPETMFIGLGYDFQECPIINIEKHDQILDFIILESLIISRNQQNEGLPLKKNK